MSRKACSEISGLAGSIITIKHINILIFDLG